MQIGESNSLNTTKGRHTKLGRNCDTKEDADLSPGDPLQLFDAAYDSDLLKVITSPDRYWSAPKSTEQYTLLCAGSVRELLRVKQGMKNNQISTPHGYCTPLLDNKCRLTAI